MLTFGVFQAGQRFNIVPDTAHLEGTVRAFDGQRAQGAIARALTWCSTWSAAQGARIEDEEIPSPATATRSTTTTLRSPLACARQPGAGAGPRTGAGGQALDRPEDFPQLGQSVRAPSVYFFVGATPVGRDPPPRPATTPRFFLDEGALERAPAPCCYAALDVLLLRPRRTEAAR